MGVTGLWQILQPCARPIKIETLNRRRLAVDASIWIYQFLKAVRDKEGNALRNSHVVGFFRRICKLLFFGIKPVFVFDGGAPSLKRQTIRARKSRREGRREDAVRTAGKLLAVQMQRRAEEDEAQRKAERERRAGTGTAQTEEEAVPDEGLVYVDELQMTQQERQQNRKFRKKDQYHLPDLQVSMEEMGGPNDPRVMSLEDLQAYARQFDTGEDINVYDFSKIDYDSAFFMSLPPSDRYNILNAARLRSRLRMGHSKEQLDTMFPDRMAFSKFQIERVRERNELTQRLMHLNESGGGEYGGGRIAGEKGREYVLVKNDGVEGGWALGVIDEEGKEEKPIDLDKPVPVKKDDEEWEDENEFEDIPIEGLNRLPKQKTRNEQTMDELTKQRRAVYQSRNRRSRRKPAKRKVQRDQDPESLFVQSSDEEEAQEATVDEELFGDEEHTDDEDLRKAIAMSMQQEQSEDQENGNDIDDDDMMEVFQQSAVEEARPLPKGSGRAIANIVNKRAFDVAPESREVTSFGVPTQKPDSSDDEDTMDLQAALAESRRTKRKTSPSRRKPAPTRTEHATNEIARKAGFSGPLPFEKLDLGSSLLGKKKMQQRTEEAAGGFENPELAEKQSKKNEPLPPWFSGDVEKALKAQKEIEAKDRQRAKEFNKQFQFQDRGQAPTLRRGHTDQIIDLEAEDEEPSKVIDLEAEDVRIAKSEQVQPSLGDIADEVRADPPTAFERDEAFEQASSPTVEDSVDRPAAASSALEEAKRAPSRQDESDDGMIEWSESEPEDNVQRSAPVVRRQDTSAVGAEIARNQQERAVKSPISRKSRSPSLEFEDVGDASAPENYDGHGGSSSVDVEDFRIPDDLTLQDLPGVDEEEQEFAAPQHTSGLVAQESVPQDDNEFDDFSDPEDAEMLRNLTIEAEEHARFASTLNHKTQAQNIEEYEKELKQLRNQQKKDRRDADEVTQTMILECQALLRLFGLPYVTAPMEAEAQCAELVRLGLVDGIVTDDSDCFLFGGTRIYKNMFNQAKFVECYLSSDLEKEFDLTRDKLISVAQLLGSDYTEGIPHVGPVTALEIISEFTRLEDFRDWLSKVQLGLITKEEDRKTPFRKKFRKSATKIFLPSAFPDQRVEMAYKNPEVDHDPEAFQWGVPDLNALRTFLMVTIGWTQERTDEVLVPVIKDMNRRLDEGTQANITAFFDGGVGIGAAGVNEKGEAYAPRKRVDPSKRMGTALTRMAEKAKMKRGESMQQSRLDGDGDEGEVDVETVPAPKPSASTTNGSRKRKTKVAASKVQMASDDDDDAEFAEPAKKKPKRKAVARIGGKGRQSEKAAQVD